MACQFAPSTTLGVDLGVPEHLQLLAWRVVLYAGEAHERTVSRRGGWRNALDEVLARADADDLAGLEIHLVVKGPGAGAP